MRSETRTRKCQPKKDKILNVHNHKKNQLPFSSETRTTKINEKSNKIENTGILLRITQHNFKYTFVLHDEFYSGKKRFQKTGKSLTLGHLYLALITSELQIPELLTSERLSYFPLHIIIYTIISFGFKFQHILS